MLWFPAVVLTILLGGFQFAAGEIGSQCPPSAMKITILVNLNNTSDWPTVSLTQKANHQPSWKANTNHRIIQGNSILESTFDIWASETGDSFDIPKFAETAERQITINVIPQKKAQHTANDGNVAQTQATISPNFHRTSEKSVQGYDSYEGYGHYKFHHGVTTWPAARDTCAREGGHLVIINSKRERDLVQHIFYELNPVSVGSSNPKQIHVGLKRVDEGNYTTIFGVPMEETGFAEWSEGQPSGGAREPCVSYMMDSMKYNDISCNIQILAFICEKESRGRPAKHAQDEIHIGTDKQPEIPERLEVEPFPLGYELFPGIGYYKFHHSVATWPAARDVCAQEGGHLVVINSEAEREVIRELFGIRNPISEGSSNSNQIHAGLRRVAEGNYTTIYGVPIEDTGFSEWAPGQPNSGANEPCVSIMKKTVDYNDISCRIQILAYICEVELGNR